MGWRFRRRITLFPGVKINLSLRGISTTFGVPGASINIGKQGAYLNTGFSGTGIYNRTRIGNSLELPKTQDIPTEISHPVFPSYFLPEELGAICSRDNNSITSEGLKGVKQTLLAALQQKKLLETEVKLGEIALRKSNCSLSFIKIISFQGYFFKKTLQKHQQEFEECGVSLQEAQRQLIECKVIIEVKFDSVLTPIYNEICYNFERLQASEFCWDVTASVQINRIKERSYAGTSISRKPVSVKKASLDFVESEHLAFRFINANGADLYLFPAFLLVFRSSIDFALIDYRFLSIKYFNVRFVEEQTLPKDTNIVGSTWKYVNKDGSRDRRFSNNCQIPIVLYGEIHFTSPQGLNEAYEFSNTESARAFVESMLKYQQAISGLPVKKTS
jgi:hypothetical protein